MNYEFAPPIDTYLAGFIKWKSADKVILARLPSQPEAKLSSAGTDSTSMQPYDYQTECPNLQLTQSGSRGKPRLLLFTRKQRSGSNFVHHTTVSIHYLHKGQCFAPIQFCTSSYHW